MNDVLIFVNNIFAFLFLIKFKKRWGFKGREETQSGDSEKKKMSGSVGDIRKPGSVNFTEHQGE